MIDFPWRPIVEGFGLGVLASGVFFAGLAWGLRHALQARRPALVLIASFLLRAGLLIGAGWWLARHSQPVWSVPAFALAFFMVRAVAVRRARRGTPRLASQEGR
jgi:F1F0 ATPase subunit 2